MGRRLLLFALLCFDRCIPHSVLLIAIGENLIKMIFHLLKKSLIQYCHNASRDASLLAHMES